MAIAKIIYKENASATPEVWMDTTDKTAASGNMLSGTTALKNDGTDITGNIAFKTSANMTASGATVTAPAGYYASDASKSVASGTEGTPTATKGTVSNHSISVTPSVTNTAGYISGGTHSGTAATVSASELVSGTKSITENGTNIDVTNYAAVDVAVSGSSANIQPLSVTVNGTYTASGNVDGYSPVTVNVSGGSGSAERKDVNFYDYDGTIVASYTTAEFANISALPSNPSHTGLTAQGWNMPSTWTLSDAKTYVATNKKSDFGQMYTTTSGATEIDVEFTDINRLSPIMSLAVNGTVSVDWGDGGTIGTVTDTSLSTRKSIGPHAYPAVGKYTIKITATSGSSWGFYGTSTYTLLYKNQTATLNRVYSNCVKAVRIGDRCISIGDNAFYNCNSLVSITIPSSVTSVGNNAFNNCNSLVSVTIPSNITNFGTYLFKGCFCLTSISIPCSVTNIGTYSFQNCYALPDITIPSSVTSIGTYSFQNCYALPGITMSSGVTSIDTNAFNGCNSLTSITIPSGVTTIGTKAFQNCYGLGSIHFKPTVPPTLNASDAFSGVPTDCIIYVPTGKRSDYTSATYYPNSSTYTYIEE